MQVSPKPIKVSRSKIGRIAMAVAFALVICNFGVGSAGAAEHGGGDGHGGGYHGGWGGGHYGGGYYAPGPDYWVAPEPYVYVPAPGPCYAPGYEGPEYDPYCNPPPPPGVSLFFGL